MKISVCVPGIVDTDYYDETDLSPDWLKSTFLDCLKDEMKKRNLYESIEYFASMGEIKLTGTYQGEPFQLMLNEGLQRFRHEIGFIADLDDELWKLLPDAVNKAVESTNNSIKAEYGSEFGYKPLKLKWDEERPSEHDDYCFPLW